MPKTKLQLIAEGLFIEGRRDEARELMQAIERRRVGIIAVRKKRKRAKAKPPETAGEASFRRFDAKLKRRGQ